MSKQTILVSLSFMYNDDIIGIFEFLQNLHERYCILN